MKFCGNCGAQNDDDAVICGECGNKIDEVAENTVENSVGSGKKSNSVFEFLDKYKAFFLNGFVLLASILVIAASLVGGFSVQMNIPMDGNVSVTVHQNVYDAVDAFELYMDLDYDYNNNSYMGEYAEEYRSMTEQIQTALQTIYLKYAAMGFAGGLSESAKEDMADEIGEALSDFNMLKYVVFRGEAGNSSYYERGEFAMPVPYELVIILAVLALPVSISAAVVSLIFLILAAIAMARKKSGRVNTLLTVMFILSGVQICIFGAGGMSASGWMIAAIAVLLACIVAVCVLNMLTNDEFILRSAVRSGVTAALSVAVALLSVITIVPNVSTYDGEIVIMALFNPLKPVVFGLSCAIFARAFAALCRKDFTPKYDGFAIAVLVLACIAGIMGVLFTPSRMGSKMLVTGLPAIIAMLLSIGQLVFLRLYRAVPNTKD